MRRCVWGLTPVASEASAATVALGRTVVARSASVNAPPKASSDGMMLGVTASGRRPSASTITTRRMG